MSFFLQLLVKCAGFSIISNLLLSPFSNIASFLLQEMFLLLPYLFAVNYFLPKLLSHEHLGHFLFFQKFETCNSSLLSHSKRTFRLMGLKKGRKGNIIGLKHCLSFLLLFSSTLHKNWSFPLRLSSVNVTKSVANCGLGYIYWRNP